MSVDLTDYDVLFRAPALPLPRAEYSREEAMKLSWYLMTQAVEIR